MTKKDWHFTDDNNICNFRSAGVLISNNKILIQREIDGQEYALPGGHVHIGETSKEAVIREFKEETGIDVIYKRMLWVDESFWTWGTKNAHTIAFYHLLSLNKLIDFAESNEFFSQRDNCNILLKWVNIEEINNLIIYPTFIKEKINNFSENIEHFICN